MESFEKSEIWKATLATQVGVDPCEAARTRLRDSFLKTRKAIIPVVGQIAKELPDLTVHDITHLDSLWNIADTLVGDDFEINPAEAYVLGMTFLFHDAATSTYAFENGIDGLRNTTEWKDFVAQMGYSAEELKEGEKGYQLTLFETLRILHPNQAELLLSQSWKDSYGNPRWLIEDVELRNHYGRYIGKISSSHGNDAAMAEQLWANAPAITPHSSLELSSNQAAHWKVDCLKVSMLLRCADAAHVDSRRAPDMFYCLSNPTGLSKNHWLFQNRLGALGLNKNNELYWSANPFDENDSDAWWLCYRTAQMIDRQIRTANCILEYNGRSPLKAIGVMGAQDISVFLQTVPVQGWQPIEANFKVGNVRDIIEKFGGEKLYGKNPWLALKELIQNAADAIRARSSYRPDFCGQGKIHISLEESGDQCWLHVQDNGIGMSKYVLTNVLLDFGRSLWNDPVVRNEWAGLSSKGFESVGQFGIGFFSIFMLGSEVKVTTWRCGDAESQQCTLLLRDSTNATPILLYANTNEYLSEYGTRVSVRLNNGRSSILKHYKSDSFFISDKTLTLDETIGALAPALDINVFSYDNGVEHQVIKANDWEELAWPELLKRMAPFWKWDERLDHYSPLHDVRDSDGRLVGRLGLDGTGYSGFGFDMGALIHKGLVVGRAGYSGVLLSGNNSNLARDEAVPICSSEALKKWAISAKAECKSFSRNSRLLSLGASLDGLEIGYLSEDRVTASDITDFVKTNNIDAVMILLESINCPHEFSQQDFDERFNYYEGVITPLGTVRETCGLDKWITTLLPDSVYEPRSAITAIRYAILQAWPNSTPDRLRTSIGTIDGVEVEAECMVFRK